MDRWQALYKFWSSFGIPAYRENRVPDLKDVTFPYITYEAGVSGWGEEFPLSASIWDENTSPERIDRLSDMIENKIRTLDPIDFDKGKLRIWISDESFAEDMGDPDNDKILRKRLSVMVEFMMIY